MINSRKEIHEAFIEKMNLENLQNSSIQNWKDFFSSRLAQVMYNTHQYGIKPSNLYRARINYDYYNNQELSNFKHIKDLGAPPRSKVKNLGRCNISGQSMLYLTENLESSVYETQPKIGQKISIIKYSVLQDIQLLSVIGVKKIMEISSSHNNIFKNHFNNKEELSVLVDDILSLQFSLKLPPNKSHLIYKMTNAIVQILLDNSRKKSNNNPKTSEQSIGIIYPTVESPYNSMNFCLFPNKTKSIISASSVQKFSVEKSKKYKYKLTLTDKSNKIMQNGEILWSKNFRNDFIEI